MLKDLNQLFLWNLLELIMSKQLELFPVKQKPKQLSSDQELLVDKKLSEYITKQTLIKFGIKK